MTFTPPFTANGKTVAKLSRIVTDDATNRTTVFMQAPMKKPLLLWSQNGFTRGGHVIPAYNDSFSDADVEARIRAAMTSGEFAECL